MYVKFIDETTIEPAPSEYNGNPYYNFDSNYEQLLKDGYKLLILEKTDISNMLNPEQYYTEEETTITERFRDSFKPEDLQKLKDIKSEEINQARELARKTEGAEFNDDLFDIDETSQSNILAQMKVAELLKSEEATYTYRSKTNKNHELTVSQLQLLGLSIAKKVNEIYAKSWELKAQVDAATSKEDLDKIIW